MSREEVEVEKGVCRAVEEMKGSLERMGIVDEVVELDGMQLGDERKDRWIPESKKHCGRRCPRRQGKCEGCLLRQLKLAPCVARMPLAESHRFWFLCFEIL